MVCSAKNGIPLKIQFIELLLIDFDINLSRSVYFATLDSPLLLLLVDGAFYCLLSLLLLDVRTPPLALLLPTRCCTAILAL